MPKQYLRLSDFSGGLNTRFDARDINDNELTAASNVQVYKSGQIFTVTPNADFHADLDRSAGTTTSGYGLFLFKADNDLSNSPFFLLTVSFFLSFFSFFVSLQWIM